MRSIWILHASEVLFKLPDLTKSVLVLRDIAFQDIECLPVLCVLDAIK
jgi:hypothetical protein